MNLCRFMHYSVSVIFRGEKIHQPKPLALFTVPLTAVIGTTVYRCL